MNKNLLKLFLIPLFVTLIYFVLASIPYFTHFGITSVVEEKNVNFENNIKFGAPLLKNQKATGTFKASENNLGILLIRFIKFGKGSDTLVFRLKKGGEDKWYYENKYLGEQFKEGKYFTFGFPPIVKSKNIEYFFEIESIDGRSQNAIGISQKRPQTAFVYSYSKTDLKNFKTLLPFASKKLNYALKNVDYRIVLSVFVLTLFLIFFMKKNKITLPGTKNFLVFLIKNPKRIIYFYILFKKKLQYILKFLSHKFLLTKAYRYFLNTDMKKKLLIFLLIFVIAILYRFSMSLIFHESLFYYALGGQGDYDQLIRSSTCVINSLCVGILIYNFLILAPFLGILFTFFGFIGGLKAFLYIMLIISSIVAILPYALLTFRKNWFSVGGIIGSLFLATSDFLTNMALGFPSDNSSVFTFSIFFIVYFLTLNKGTIRWLLFFGLMGLIDGLNKVLFLINSLGVFLLFVPVLFFEKAGKIRKSIFVKSNFRILTKALLPLTIFILLYVVWEIITYTQFFKSRYFLWQLVFQGGRSWSSYVTTDATIANNLFSQVIYLGVSGVVMIKRLIQYSGLSMFLLLPIFLGMFLLIFKKKKFPIKRFLLTVVFSSLIITLLFLIKENYFKIHDVFPGEYILYNWKWDTYVGILLFLEVIFLFVLNFKYYALKLSLPILTYMAMLILLAKGAPFPRLHAHVVVWGIVLIAFLIDWIFSNLNTRSVLKIRGAMLAPLFLIAFIIFYVFPKTEIMIEQLSSGLSIDQEEISYLNWVNSEIPDNAIVLGGKKEDLITLGENVKKPIVYNSFFGAAMFIPKNRDHRLVKEFKIVDQLKKKENFKKNKYIILEENIKVWQNRLTTEGDAIFSTTSASLLNPTKYLVKVYKFNPKLNKRIYELVLKTGSREELKF